MRGLTDKGVLVSGGSSGIGEATVRRFLEEGGRVYLCGLDADEVRSTMGELSSLGPVDGLACDIGRDDDVARLVDAAETALGSIDVLINNAGIAHKDAFLEMDVAEWDRIVRVNLRGMFLVAQAVARRMVARGSGVIVNMASTNALGGEELLAHYNASKGGSAPSITFRRRSSAPATRSPAESPASTRAPTRTCMCRRCSTSARSCSSSRSS